jgi:hypothetical protein
MMDPFFFDDDLYDDVEAAYEMEQPELTDDCIYETFDELIAEREFEAKAEHASPDDAATMGSMLAFADIMKDEERYDLDEHTDQENFALASRLTPKNLEYEVGPSLRPFEQYVRDFIQRGFRHPDD